MQYSTDSRICSKLEVIVLTSIYMTEILRLNSQEEYAQQELASLKLEMAQVMQSIDHLSRGAAEAKHEVSSQSNQEQLKEVMQRYQTLKGRIDELEHKDASQPEDMARAA